MYNYVIEAFVILVIILIIIICYFYSRDNFSQQSIKKRNVNSLVRQMYRWYIASTQDSEVIIKNLHSNYAMGYLSALRDIATDDEINKITGLNIEKIGKAIAIQQDNSLIAFAKQCPNLIPDDDTYRDYIKKFLPNVV